MHSCRFLLSQDRFSQDLQVMLRKQMRSGISLYSHDFMTLCHWFSVLNSIATAVPDARNSSANFGYTL